MKIYVIKLGFIIILAEAVFVIKLGILTKLFSTLLVLSYLIFTFQRRLGTAINEFSALDLLMIIFSIGGIVLSNLGFAFSTWFFLTLFSLWFGLRFVFFRTLYLGL